MRRVSARKVRASDPASFYAVVLEDARPVWSCHHDHPERRLAKNCARRWLRTLRSDAPDPAGGGEQDRHAAARRRRRGESQPLLGGRKPVLRRSFLEGLLGCAVYEPDSGQGAAYGSAVHDAIHAYWQACLAAGTETRLAAIDPIVAQVMGTPRGLSYHQRDDLYDTLDYFARTHTLDLERLWWTDGRPWIERELRADGGWCVVTGQPDLVERVDGDDQDDPVRALLCHDYKSSWSKSDYIFQGRTYAQLAFLSVPTLEEFGWLVDSLHRSGQREPQPIIYQRGELDMWWEDMLATARSVWELRRAGRANPTGGAQCDYCDLRYVCAGATLVARESPENDDQAMELAQEWVRMAQATKARRAVLAKYTERYHNTLQLPGMEVGWLTPREAAWKATDPMGIVAHAAKVGHPESKEWIVTWVDTKQIPNELKPGLVEAGVARYELGEPGFKSRKLTKAEQSSLAPSAAERRLVASNGQESDGATEEPED